MAFVSTEISPGSSRAVLCSHYITPCRFSSADRKYTCMHNVYWSILCKYLQTMQDWHTKYHGMMRYYIRTSLSPLKKEKIKIKKGWGGGGGGGGEERAHVLTCRQFSLFYIVHSDCSLSSLSWRNTTIIACLSRLKGVKEAGKRSGGGDW